MISQRALNLKPSPTMAMAAKSMQLKSEGHDVVSLATGEPDFNTSSILIESMNLAISEGLTRYTPAAGLPQIRESIAAQYASFYEVSLSKENVVISTGAKQALYGVIQCLVNPGDKVIVPTPAWVSYEPMIELAQGKMIKAPLEVETQFVPTEEWLEKIPVDSDTKGIIINSPSNPSGVVWNKETLQKLVSWANRHDLWLISDEVYEKIIFDGLQHQSLMSWSSQLKERLIVISSLSKSYAMTGWRCGWVVGCESLVKKVSALQSQSISNVTSFVQATVPTAFAHSDEITEPMRQAFESRRSLCLDSLDEIEALSYIKPQGAFYIFLNLEKTLRQKKLQDIEFCLNLLEQKYVAMVPGSAFHYPGWARMSFATSDEQLKKALQRLSEFVR